MRFRHRVREALSESVADLEAAVARPPIIREAEVWSEKEIQEVESVRDQLNAYTLRRNLAIREDLIGDGGVNQRAYAEAIATTPRRSDESSADHHARVLAKAREASSPPPVRPPTVGRWEAWHAEAERLAAKDIALDPLNYEAMKRELERREIEDAEALDKALREANDADAE